MDDQAIHGNRERLVSIGHLDRPGVDYAAYAGDNFDRLETALAAFRTRFGTP